MGTGLTVDGSGAAVNLKNGFSTSQHVPTISKFDQSSSPVTSSLYKLLSPKVVRRVFLGTWKRAWRLRSLSGDVQFAPKTVRFTDPKPKPTLPVAPTSFFWFWFFFFSFFCLDLVSFLAGEERLVGENREREGERLRDLDRERLLERCLPTGDRRREREDVDDDDDDDFLRAVP